MSRKLGILSTAAAAALSVALMSAPAYAGDIVGLITKTNTNPFFVKMKEGFEAKAKELGLTPQAYAGKFDGDNDGAGRRDRGADRRRRQGHPAGSERFDRDRADRQEGARRRHPGDHARHAARSDRRRRRQFRHRQFQGRRADRPMGESDARRQGRRAPRSPPSTSPPTSRRSTISATTASSPASASRSRIPSISR